MCLLYTYLGILKKFLELHENCDVANMSMHANRP